tara:strand:- start:15504 stop:15695 length:192 start_codon:yes stop_codon:yes gene_type:complete
MFDQRSTDTSNANASMNMASGIRKKHAIMNKDTFAKNPIILPPNLNAIKINAQSPIKDNISIV